MIDKTRFRWGRIALAILAAEALPILALVLIVMAYGFVRSPDSLSPKEFAPQAGNWVGPIAGFLATLLLAFWAARGADGRRMAHGAAVGVGTSLLDFSLGLLLGGGDGVLPILVLSNAGRIIAGALGGWLAHRQARQDHPDIDS